MARGTKTYTTGKVRSTRTNTIVHTYSNVDPAGTFQTGDYIFNLEYFEPELNSLDCVDPDNIPNAFTFTDVNNSEINTLYTSNMITISGLGLGNSIAITISSGEYSKNGGAYTSVATTAVNGDTFTVRNTSSGSYITAVNTTLNAGSVSDTYSITTKVAPAVTVNYSFSKDNDPTVDIVLVPVRDGVNINNIYGSSSGTFAATFAGNIMDMYLVHQLAYMPWPADSSASLVIKKDGVNIYDSGVITNPNQEQIGAHTFTLEEGSVYDVVALSDSTSTAYTSATINWDDQTGGALNNVMYEFEDSDSAEPFIMHTTQPVQPLNNVGINWLIGAGLGRLDIITNDSGLSLDIQLSNIAFGGGYDTTINVPIGGTGFFANIPKTSYNITITTLAL